VTNPADVRIISVNYFYTRGNKMPTRYNRCFYIADLIVCSTRFRHYYALHQELESIIQMVAACGIWCFGFQVIGMVWS
jgi:hypothetical protein